MKKTNFWKSLTSSAMCLAMMAVVCLTGFTSCSEDEGIGDDAPYAGVYKFTEVTLSAYGEKATLNAKQYGMESELVFNADNTYSFTVVYMGEGSASGVDSEESGTYSYSKDSHKLTLVVKELNGHQVSGSAYSVDVKAWTSNVFKYGASIEDGSVEFTYKK